MFMSREVLGTKSSARYGYVVAFPASYLRMLYLNRLQGLEVLDSSRLMSSRSQLLGTVHRLQMHELFKRNFEIPHDNISYG
jgi:hypothetical protein